MPARAHKPTDESRRQAQAMAGYGNSQDEIAIILGISDTTLRKYYKAELKAGSAIAKVNIGRVLYESSVGRDATVDAHGNIIRTALSPDKNCLIFSAKARLGFSETTRTELTGAAGGPIELTSLDLSKLSLEEKRIVLALLEKAGARADRAA